MFCLVGDRRGCGLVESTIQTIRKKLWVMQLEKNFIDIETTPGT